jgi:hypothetical protein
MANFFEYIDDPIEPDTVYDTGQGQLSFEYVDSPDIAPETASVSALPATPTPSAQTTDAVGPGARFTPEGIKSGISAAQLLLSPLPTSPITEYLGEGAKSLIDGEDFEEANKAGMTAAGIDFGLRLALGGLPSAFGKFGVKAAQKVGSVAPDVAKKVAESTLAQKGLFGVAGEAASKLSLGKSQRFSDEIVDEVIKRPELVDPKKLKEAPKTIDSIAAKAHASIVETKKELGRLVGDVKKSVEGQSIKADIAPVIDEINILKDMVAPSVREASERGAKTGFIPQSADEVGYKAIQTLDDAFSSLTKSPGPSNLEVPVSEGGETVLKTLEDFPNVDITEVDNLNRVLQNIDESDAFQAIYKDASERGSGNLTNVKRQALEIRNKIRDSIDDAVVKALDDTGFSEAKGNYAKFRRALDEPEIHLITKGPDNAASILTRSLKTGRQETYKQLRNLESVMPEERRFMDSVISKVAGDELGVILPTKDISTTRIGMNLIGKAGQSFMQPVSNAITPTSVLRGGIRTSDPVRELAKEAPAIGGSLLNSLSAF